MGPRWWCVALAGLIVSAAVLLVGCGTSPPTQDSPASAQPAPDPCALFSPEQLKSRELHAGVDHLSRDPQVLGGRSCTWTNSPIPQDQEYTAQLLKGTINGNSPAIPLAGLTTSEIHPVNMDMRNHCVYAVELPTATTLWIEYGNPSGNIDGIDHAEACYSAREAAFDMIQSYETVTQDR